MNDTNINDGGPAFPVAGHCVDASGAYCGDVVNSKGLSLRDWFAGQYDVSGIKFPDIESAAKFLGEEPPDKSDFVSLVEMSFRLNAKLKYMGSDAMLAAKKEKV